MRHNDNGSHDPWRAFRNKAGPAWFDQTRLTRTLRAGDVVQTLIERVAGQGTRVLSGQDTRVLSVQEDPEGHETYCLAGEERTHARAQIAFVRERWWGNPCRRACDELEHKASARCRHCRGVCGCRG